MKLFLPYAHTLRPPCWRQLVAGAPLQPIPLITNEKNLKGKMELQATDVFDVIKKLVEG
ncbi:MAG: hypothetical protein ABI723_21155 [Bacteroidia bacterium]